MVTSSRVYARGDLPRKLLPLLPSLWWGPADPRFHRRPSNTSGQFGFSLLWSHCSFPLVLVCTRFCLCPPRLESVFPPVLWKFSNQVPLPSRSASLGVPSPFVGSPGWEAWHVVPNLHNSGRALVLLFSSLWVTHPAAVGFDFIMITPLLPSCWGLFFVFGLGVSSFSRFQHPPVDDCSTVSCDFGALAGDECLCFYSAILNQKKQNYLVFNCEEITQSWNGVDQHF